MNIYVAKILNVPRHISSRLVVRGPKPNEPMLCSGEEDEDDDMARPTPSRSYDLPFSSFSRLVYEENVFFVG